MQYLDKLVCQLLDNQWNTEIERRLLRPDTDHRWQVFDNNKRKLCIACGKIRTQWFCECGAACCPASSTRLAGQACFRDHLFDVWLERVEGDGTGASSRT